MVRSFFYSPRTRCTRYVYVSAADVRKLHKKPRTRPILLPDWRCSYIRLILCVPYRRLLSPVLQQWSSRQLEEVVVLESIQLQLFARSLVSSIGETDVAWLQTLLKSLAIFLRHPNNTAYLFYMSNIFFEIEKEFQ